MGSTIFFPVNIKVENVFYSERNPDRRTLFFLVMKPEHNFFLPWPNYKVTFVLRHLCSRCALKIIFKVVVICKIFL